MENDRSEHVEEETLIKIKDGVVHLSAQEIAKRLGVTTRTVARWSEQGYVVVHLKDTTKPNLQEKTVKLPLHFQRVFPTDSHKFLAIDDANRLFLLHGIHPLTFAEPKVFTLEELYRDLVKNKL